MSFQVRFFAPFLVAFVVFASLTQTALAARPLIIDTDVGVDDVIAMAYLLKVPDLEVKAITISCTGNADGEQARANTLGLLKLMHHSDIPVALGRSRPLRGNHHFPPFVLHESDTLAGTARLLPQVQAKSSSNAVALLIKTIQASREPVTILAIGPMTNIAEALQKAPQIKNNIQSLIIMGGAIHVPGNLQELAVSIKNKKSEWNIYVDPLAAKLVFKAELPLVLVPLDVTNTLPIDLKFYKQLKRQHLTPEATYVYLLLKNNEKLLKSKKWYFWDPLAAVIASDESIASYKNESLAVVLKPEERSGQIIVNASSTKHHRVVVKVDESRFKNVLLEALNKSEASS